MNHLCESLNTIYHHDKSRKLGTPTPDSEKRLPHRKRPFYAIKKKMAGMDD